jgi:hypothetical protein
VLTCVIAAHKINLSNNFPSLTSHHSQTFHHTTPPKIRRNPYPTEDTTPTSRPEPRNHDAFDRKVSIAPNFILEIGLLTPLQHS